VQHELFPTDGPEPAPAQVGNQRPKKTELDAASRSVGSDSKLMRAAPDSQSPALTSETPTSSTDDGVTISSPAPLPGNDAVSPETAATSPAPPVYAHPTIVAAMSAASLLLAVVALAIGVHASLTRSPRSPAGESDTVLLKLAGVAAGVDPSSVALDVGHKRLQAHAVLIPGADLSTYQALEQRVQMQVPRWTVAIVPPLQPVPQIRFADGADDLSASAKRAVESSAWAARRWGIHSVGVPGFIDPMPRHPLLPQRRAQAVATILRAMGVRATPLHAEGQAFRLRLPWPQPS
jgi:hypothetical protein